MNNKESSFLTRHAQSSKRGNASLEYNALSPEGVEQARDAAKKGILELIQNAPSGAVIFIGGASDQARTGQTAEVYGETLNEIVYEQKNNNEIEVVTKQNIDELITVSNKKRASDVAKQDCDKSLAQIDNDVAKTPDYEDVLQQITDYLKSENPDKKIVITFPVELKGFSYGFNDRWTENGKKTEYFSEALKKHNDDNSAAGLDWLENQGTLTTEDGRNLQGPNPTQVAKEYLESLRRLREFAGKHIGRSIVIGGVGHQWDLDAVVTFLASGGRDVTIENFRKFVDKPEELINNSEIISFSIDKDGVIVDYRGKQLTIDK